MEPTPPDAFNSIKPVIVATFGSYLERRLGFYRNPGKVLDALLKKDILLFALRGVSTADEFIEQAFPAYESSSEETMWGNAWQEAIAKAAPNTVGGGDLRTERDGTLWIIQLKMGPQNASAQAQDIRILQTKVRQEVDHHPGRKGVKAMYAIVRGSPRDEWRHHRDRSPANRDIDGFQYQFMVGLAFLRWISADFEPLALVGGLREQSSAIYEARMDCIGALKLLLNERLRAAGLDSDLASLMALASFPPARRKRAKKDQSSD